MEKIVVCTYNVEWKLSSPNITDEMLSEFSSLGADFICLQEYVVPKKDNGKIILEGYKHIPYKNRREFLHTLYDAKKYTLVEKVGGNSKDPYLRDDRPFFYTLFKKNTADDDEFVAVLNVHLPHEKDTLAILKRIEESDLKNFIPGFKNEKVTKIVCGDFNRDLNGFDLFGVRFKTARNKQSTCCVKPLKPISFPRRHRRGTYDHVFTEDNGKNTIMLSYPLTKEFLDRTYGTGRAAVFASDHEPVVATIILAADVVVVEQPPPVADDDNVWGKHTPDDVEKNIVNDPKSQKILFGFFSKKTGVPVPNLLKSFNKTSPARKALIASGAINALTSLAAFSARKKRRYKNKNDFFEKSFYKKRYGFFRVK